MGRIGIYGFETDSIETIKTKVQQAFQDALGLDISLSDSSPQGALINMITDLLHQIDLERQADWHSRDLNKAIGYQLDIIGKEMGLDRRLAVPTTIYVNVEGYIGTSLPAGTQAALVKNPSVLMRTKADATLTQSPQLIEFEILDNSYTEILSVNDFVATTEANLNIDTMTVQSFIRGSDIEQDYFYRLRLIESGGKFDDIRKMEQALKKIAGVQKCRVSDNKNDTVNSAGVPPHYVCIDILGGSSQDIGKALYEWLMVGTPQYLNPVGGESVQVYDEYGFPQTYIFNRPTPYAMNLHIEYSDKYGMELSTNEMEELRDMVENFINIYDINSMVYTSDLDALILNRFQDKIHLVDIHWTDTSGINIENNGLVYAPYHQYLMLNNLDITKVVV